MLADFEFRFDQHDETIRRAESNARLIAATAAAHDDRPDPHRRRPWGLLRRVAQTFAST